MRESGVDMQMINGRNDLVAGVCWVKKLAKQLKCPLILTGMPQSQSPHSSHAVMSSAVAVAGAKQAQFDLPSAGKHCALNGNVMRGAPNLPSDAGRTGSA